MCSIRQTAQFYGVQCRKGKKMMDFLVRLDGNLLLWIQEYIRNPALTPVFKVITSLGNAGLIWIFFTFLLLVNKDTRKVGYISLAALLGSLLVNNIVLKNLVARIRPYDAMEGLIPLVTKPKDFSFPSGHAGSSFASACVLYRKLPRRLGVPALILAVWIALSRLYVGVHYPSDVLIGVLDGIIISYVAEYVSMRCLNR